MEFILVFSSFVLLKYFCILLPLFSMIALQEIVPQKIKRWCVKHIFILHFVGVGWLRKQLEQQKQKHPQQCQKRYSRYLPNRINFYEFGLFFSFYYNFYCTVEAFRVLYYWRRGDVPMPILYVSCFGFTRFSNSKERKSNIGRKSIERKCRTIKNTYYSRWQIHTSNTVWNISKAANNTHTHFESELEWERERDTDTTETEQKDSANRKSNTYWSHPVTTYFESI